MGRYLIEAVQHDGLAVARPQVAAQREGLLEGGGGGLVVPGGELRQADLVEGPGLA
jgi:hypothetical protein